MSVAATLRTGREDFSATYHGTSMGNPTEEYEQLKRRLYQMTCPPSTLASLKAHFSEDINSQRRFDRIQSLFALIVILEKRDVLSPEHPNMNYILGALFTEHTPRSRSRFNEEHVLPLVSGNPVDRINTQVIERIGYKWPELARNLSITESQIDCLERKYRGSSTPGMVEEIMHRHWTTYGRNFEDWRSKLQTALRSVGRIDLIEFIDDVLVHHNRYP